MPLVLCSAAVKFHARKYFAVQIMTKRDPLKLISKIKNTILKFSELIVKCIFFDLHKS